jgi:hypothetical protein
MNLQFSKGQIIDRFNFAQLAEIQQIQFLIAGRNAWGFNQPFTLLEIFLKGEPEQMNWEYFKILNLENQVVMYEAWILGSDSGTVFFANSSKSTEVEMSQSYFDSVVSDESVDILAEEISKAFKKCRQAFDDEEGGFDGKAFDSYWQAFYEKRNANPVDKNYWDNLTQALEKKLS